MSKLLTANQLCDKALQLIGAYSINDTAARGRDLRRAMEWLDMSLSEITATIDPLVIKVPKPVTVALVPGTQSYTLDSLNLAGSIPTQFDGVMMVMDAWLRQTSGKTRKALPIEPLDVFESVHKPTEEGTPQRIAISRDDPPILRTHPTLKALASGETDPGYVIDMLVQMLSPKVAPSGVTGQRPQDGQAHTFQESWQRYIVFRLAHDLGSGPVRRLPTDTLNGFEKVADRAEVRLSAFSNQENDNMPPITEPHGM